MKSMEKISKKSFRSSGFTHFYTSAFNLLQLPVFSLVLLWKDEEVLTMKSLYYYKKDAVPS